MNKPEPITLLGETDFRGMHRPFGIKKSDRQYHLALIGKTGMGKSSLIRNMILSDLDAGEGLALLDPHGDLAESIVSSSDGRTGRRSRRGWIYFNPSEESGRLGFNVLEKTNAPAHLVVTGVVSVFKKIWTTFWGPRMEHILRHTIWALLESGGNTLADAPRILLDKSFRTAALARIKDPTILEFWGREFERYAPGLRSEALSPILNKIGQFLSNTPVREVISQTHSSFNVRQIMDEGNVLIANLSKGELGEDGSALLGALLVTSFELAALSRAELTPENRRPFFLYVDEFPTVATDSFAGLLSESRKYGVNLILAMQYLDQLDDKLRNALLENVGTVLVFRVGPESARYLAPHFTPHFTREELMNLGRFEIRLRLMIDGQPSRPFSARTAFQ